MRLLVLTSEYPNRHSTHETPVVHYFAKQWIRQGHSVLVVHSRSVFPSALYPVARAFKTLVKKIFKTDFIPFHRLKGMERTALDGVDVVTIPIFKLLPHTRFLHHTIQQHARIIYGLCSSSGFVPDVIICHFLNPQLPLISELKQLYPGVTASLVLHEEPSIISQLFRKRTSVLLDKVDALGFRYDAQKVRFVSEHGERPNLFLCPSGVPEHFILDAVPPSKFRGTKLTLCFVGMLIPLKNVDVLLRALHEAFPQRDFFLRIVGDGFLQQELETLACELGLADCVRFEGRMSREAVQAVLVQSDIFVMVSKPEAFGLTYLEAMAKGCLTIGTRGQGIDGVISSGQNGFLCDARDVSNLRDTLRWIDTMTVEERLRIAEAARQTAARLSDDKVADAYLATLGVRPPAST